MTTMPSQPGTTDAELGGGPERSQLISQLVLALEQLPAGRAAALRVVKIVDDPSMGAAEAAHAVSADPALTARILRVANSVYYGLSGRVASPAFAITVIGFQTVRSLAVMNAAGLASPDAFPPGFWAHSSAVASGASLVARRVGAGSAEAFSTGLLHDLGSALVRQHDRAGYDEILRLAEAGGLPVPVQELQTYGDTSASLCSQVLRSWRFPYEMCDAIARRYDLSDRKGPPMVRALHGGLALAALAAAEDRATPGPAGQAALSAAGVKPDEVADLVDQVRAAAQQLAESLDA